jgi:hypothetical protein
MRRLLIPLMALTVLSLGALPAAAAGPASTTIDVHTDIGQPGTFTADSSALCDSGTTSDVGSTSTVGSTTFFHDDKTFTCTDGSGTFTLHIEARVVDCAATDRGSWIVVSGTDDYAGLIGGGKLVGTYYPDPPNHCTATGIDDHLTGRLWLP